MRNSRSARIAALAASLAALCACQNPSGPSSPTPPSQAPATNAEHIAMLAKLTGSSIDTSGPKDKNGDSLPAGYNPLSSPSSVLNKESEIFLAGMDGDDGAKLFNTTYASDAIFDGKSLPAFGSVWSASQADLTAATFPWTTLHKKAAGADVDGDGREEICVLYMTSYTPTGSSDVSHDLMLDIYDGKPSSSSLLKELKLATFADAAVKKFYPNDAAWNASLDLVAGRFRGTGEYQLAASAMGTVYVIRSAGESYAVPKPKVMEAAVDGGLQILNLAAGDLNGDGRDEIVAMNGLLSSTSKGSSGTAYYEVLDGSLDALAGPTPISCGSVSISSGSVAVGDLDGDHQYEIAFTGNQGAGGVYAVVVNGAMAAGTKTPYAALAWGKASGSVGWYSVGCALLDYNGDGAEEILGGMCLFDNLANASGASLKVTQDEAAFRGSLGPLSAGMYYDDCVAVGQFNASASGKMADSFTDLAFLSADCGNLIVCSWSTKGGSMAVSNVDTSDGCYGYYPCLAAANIDDDSTYIKYLGHELLYSDPHVVALLSCYPFWSGIDMSGGGNAGSSYTTGTSGSTGTDRNVGVSAGISFGVTGGIPKYAEVSFETSITASFDYNWSSEREISVSKSFTTQDEDCVVFTSIPYDVYYYEVSSSPDAAKGERIVMSVPRAPVISSAEVGFYNDNNGACQDVTTGNLITHAIGNPRSYPNPQFVRDRIGDGSMLIYSDDANISPGTGGYAAQVGEGTGVQSIELSFSDTSSSSKSWDTAIEVELSMVMNHVEIGASVGFHYGESYSISRGTTTAFSGAIGKLSKADAQAGKGFPFTVFVYKKLLANTSDEVLILEYCYEGT